MSLLVAGTVAIDNVKTPDANETSLLGGSAAYAALSAALFTKPVHLVSIVGHDYPAAHLTMLESKGVDLSGVERSDGESFTWSGEYFDDLNTRETTAVGLNVLEDWKVTIPGELGSTSEILILANMSPDNQIQTLDACPGAKFVIADTMDLWIDIARERLMEVLARIDVLVINDSEAKMFAGTSNAIVAGDELLKAGPKNVIVKLGEYGALLFSQSGEFFRCGAYPLRSVVDPTGAGDSFLGGLAGYLDTNNAYEPTFEQLKQGMIRGTVAASFTCEEFSTRRIEAVDPQMLQERLDEFNRFHAI